MEYTIQDLERVVGYREECQRQVSSIKQQIEALQNDLSRYHQVSNLTKTGEFPPDNCSHG